MHVESLHVCRRAGVEMIIAIDSTVRGPALGGCRWREYADEAAARAEACALARAMTRKAALARLALGGGKAVVRGSPARRTRDQLLAFGEFVESLAGRYITAADMGTGEAEMAVVSERTSRVIGLPRRAGGCGEPSPFTADGVVRAMRRALERLGTSVEGAHVAVQGVGSVGADLVRRLLEAGARVSVSDIVPEALRGLPASVEVIPPDAIATMECDVFAPCGPAGVIHAENVARLRCRVVCGAANNPLADPALGAQLETRGVLYVPDFLANAGGLIHLAVALDGGNEDDSRARLAIIEENLDMVLDRAREEGVDAASVAERIALGLVAGAGDIADLR